MFLRRFRPCVNSHGSSDFFRADHTGWKFADRVCGNLKLDIPIERGVLRVLRIPIRPSEIQLSAAFSQLRLFPYRVAHFSNVNHRPISRVRYSNTYKILGEM
jgi:hypothetical protein